MHVQGKAVLEWKAPIGLMGLTLGEGDQTVEPRFSVYLSPNDEDLIEGSIDEVLLNVERRITNKQLSEGVANTLRGIFDGMLTQAIPLIRLDRDDLVAEQQRVRASRRDWLISEIESGSYAAIEKLKSEYGETVRISVEVVEGS